MKTTFFPVSEDRNATIQVTYPGASPEEMEEGVVLKIEDNLKGLSGIDRVTSKSSENFATIQIEVLKHYDSDRVLADIKNAVDRINSFPVGMEPPVIFKTEGLTFVVDFAVSGDTDLKTLKKTARKIESDLLAIDGISKISLAGFPDEEIEISLKEERLRAYNLTFDQVKRAVQQANLNMTGGKVKGKKEELLIRALSKKYYGDELEDIILKATADGRIVRLKDVAVIRDQWADSPDRTYLNGKRTVRITVNNTKTEDLITVSNLVGAYMEEFNAEHEDIKLTLVRDGAKILKQRIGLLVKNGSYGAIFVVLFLALFLNPRLGFWVALGLPVAFMGMFLVGSLAGITINMMSLFGMILVVGMLVDDGIVIGESIYQEHEKGIPTVKAALEGSVKVLPAVVSGVLTTVVAFSVFFFLDGRMGEFMSDMAFVVIATLLFSLMEGAFILPAHIAHSRAMRKDAKKSVFERKMNGFMFWMRDKLYRPVLKTALTHKTIVFSVAVSLLILAFGAIRGGILKTTFFPYIDRDDITITVEMGSGTPAAVTEGVLDRLEAAALAVNRDLVEKRTDGENVIRNIMKQVGPQTNQGKLSIALLPGDKRGIESFQLNNLIRKKSGRIPGVVNLSFGMGGHFGKAVSLSLQGDDFTQLYAAKQEVRNALEDLTSLKNVADTNLPGLKEVNITLKDKSYLLGISLQDVIAGIRQGFFGTEVQRLQRGLDEVKVWVRYAEQERTSLGNLENMRIRLKDGREFNLKDIANFEIERGTLNIDHLDGKRQILITADMNNPKESLTDVLAGIRNEILPPIEERYPDIEIGFEGQSHDTAKTAASAKIVIPIILIIMFIIIVLTFRAFTQAIVVFGMVPFGFIGVAIGHMIHGIPISIMSMFGIIALLGIMVNDSLVLITSMNQLLKAGISFREAVVRAGLSRFRPIILTSVTTVAGLAPLILETSLQAQFLIPMAITVAYGLLVSTTVTLIVLPVSLILLNDIKYYTPRIFGYTKLSRESVEPAVREWRFENE
ncbi:MAG: efflux RND transporter permease subunit [FCB group bacterium]|nr:efflux RND transporter permease subunit [FCB group bacterium]